MLICLASVKGSPGVTTLALALALRWPGKDPAPLVVECDPAGGDIGARWQTQDRPGLSGLVTQEGRGPLGDGRNWAHRLTVPAGGKQQDWPHVEVVAAPPAGGAWATVGRLAQGQALAELAAVRPVLADVGRLEPYGPQLELLDAADLLLVVVRPVLDQIRHLGAWLPVLGQRCPAIRVLPAGPGPYPPADIAAVLGVAVFAPLPVDPGSAAVLAGQARFTTGWIRRPLLRAAHTVALDIANQTRLRTAQPATSTHTTAVMS